MFHLLQRNDLLTNKYLSDVMLCWLVPIAKFRKAVILLLMLLLSFTGQVEGLGIK